ncbi:MAG TPA: isocitrate lyase/PEP mutase family protein [Pseudonocardia sp.]|jgi:2-methylisocitrate lyase-like PEP mutase family enzyme
MAPTPTRAAALTVSPRARLRELLGSGELITAPGVFDGISASLAARLGFSAAYLTGAGTAAAGFGLPDIGLVSQTEMVERVRMVTGVLGDIPLIADADSGYGAPLNVVRTVREYERAGVAGLHLEDQAFPKRCGHLPDKELVTPAAYLDTLHAALDARTDPDLVIIARTDARGPLGLDAAIERANTYAEAGADVLFVEAPQDAAEIERISREVSAPLLINMVQGGLTPDTPAERLAALGFRIAIHPTACVAAAAAAMVRSLAELRGVDTSELIPRTPADLFSLVGLREWSELGERYRSGGQEASA